MKTSTQLAVRKSSTSASNDREYKVIRIGKAKEEAFGQFYSLSGFRKVNKGKDNGK